MGQCRQRRGLSGSPAARNRQLKALGIEVAFRGDAAFARPEIYEALEEDDVKCVVRLPADDNLQRNVTELLKRRAGRPSCRP